METLLEMLNTLPPESVKNSPELSGLKSDLIKFEEGRKSGYSQAISDAVDCIPAHMIDIRLRILELNKKP